MLSYSLFLIQVKEGLTKVKTKVEKTIGKYARPNVAKHVHCELPKSTMTHSNDFPVRNREKRFEWVPPSDWWTSCM